MCECRAHDCEFQVYFTSSHGSIDVMPKGVCQKEKKIVKTKSFCFATVTE